MRGFGIPAAARASMVLALAVAPARAATQHNESSVRRPFNYHTTGIVGIHAAPNSVHGPAVLQYQGVAGSTYLPGAGQPIDLGQFVVPPGTVTNGQATTYDHTPFAVQVRAPEFDKTSSVPLLDKAFPKLGNKLGLKTVTESSLLIRGQLNGTVSPAGQSDVTATINTVRPGGLEKQTQDHVTRYAFPIRFGDLTLPPSWMMSSMTPGMAAASAELLTPAPTAAPEPSTLALFGAILGGLALARRRNSR